ncbi:glycosyltransferase family 4 protein [Metabacillus sp. FJAT-52054]|uniref:Glycosyltransferase family 4 protein n=1 Tax=Metabacillus sediminis TaxID=3117746 RepID=A0ABZ2NFW9_9BACI
MKVLFLTNIPSPYRVEFFNELGKKCDLTVLFERENASDRNEKWFDNNSNNFKSFVLKGIKVRADSALNIGVIKFLNFNYDIIVIGGYATPTSMLSILYLKARRISFILNADGGFISKDEKFFKKSIKSFFISSAEYWLSTGIRTSEYLKYYGANENNIFQYPFTSITTKTITNKRVSVFEKKLLKNKLNIHSNKVVISVGQFIHRKGMDILLNCWNEIRVSGEKVELLLVGGGELKEEYQRIIKEKDISVRIIDFKPKEELQMYYKIADIMVLPTREDIWGLVINEAFSYGLPVITTDKCVAGIELIKNHENGYIIPMKNIEALPYKINELLSNSLLIDKMAKNNLEKIKTYTIENMASKHMYLFKKVKL